MRSDPPRRVLFALVAAVLSAGGDGAAAQVLSVSISSPAEGAVVLDPFTVGGTSAGAVAIELSADGGVFVAAEGLDLWTFTFEGLSLGSHTVTVRARAGRQQVFDSVTVVRGVPLPGQSQVTYSSSVDGAPLGAKLWIPAGFDPLSPAVPLVLHLHGGGGTGEIPTAMRGELDARGWIALAPDGREWNLANQGCPWPNSAAYVDSPDPDVSPGERDILDALDWALANYPIDADRIYLTGFSFGGRGAYTIGLRNPDRFAASGALAPTVDMYEIFVRRPDPTACKEGITGGAPAADPFVDTMYTITSARFLIENAHNLPVYHGHGLLDHTANNDPLFAPFLHGWHITSDVSWDGCHGGTFCFGHTPTLAELEAIQPDGYDWSFMFTPVAHRIDARWLQGTAVGGGSFGEEDPLNPGELLGMMDFFGRHTLVTGPDTVIYKTYTDQHRGAYWLELDITTPWLDSPGAVRAARDVVRNALEAELVRASAATFDIAAAGLRLTESDPLILEVMPLVEPVFDPALDAAGEPLDPVLVVRGDFAGLPPVTVFRDGSPLPDALVDQTPSEIGIGPVSIGALTVFEIDAGGGEVETDTVTITRAEGKAGEELRVEGVNGALPQGGFAASVTIHAGNVSGGDCPGEVLGTASVGTNDGKWRFEDKTIDAVPSTVCVESSGGGVDGAAVVFN